MAKTHERETISKRLNKYIAAFDYFDKTLLVLFTASVFIYIALLATVIGAPVGMTSENLSLVFSISNGIAKKI